MDSDLGRKGDSCVSPPVQKTKFSCAKRSDGMALCSSRRERQLLLRRGMQVEHSCRFLRCLSSLARLTQVSARLRSCPQASHPVHEAQRFAMASTGSSSNKYAAIPCAITRIPRAVVGRTLHTKISCKGDFACPLPTRNHALCSSAKPS